MRHNPMARELKHADAWQQRADVFDDDDGTIEFNDGIPAPEPERLWTGSGDTGIAA